MAATDNYSSYWLICSLLSVLMDLLEKLDREIDSFLQLTVQKIKKWQK